MFGPTTGVIENEATGFTVEFFFFKQFGDTHGFDGPTGGMGDKKVEAFLLE